METKEIIKERLDILGDELREFILNEGWRSDVKKICERYALDEEQSTVFENEVFFSLLCIEKTSDIEKNLKDYGGFEEQLAGWVSEEAQKYIFNNVQEYISEFWQSMNEIAQEQEPAKKERQINTGNDFEQLIINQARAMQPARIASSEAVAGGPARTGEAPQNLPTQDKPRVIHNYIGQDPYREAVE